MDVIRESFDGHLVYYYSRVQHTIEISVSKPLKIYLEKYYKISKSINI